MPETAPEDPGKPAFADKGWAFVWGGDWQKTPTAVLGDSTREALGYCAKYFDADTNARLAAASAYPGSLYIRTGVGETIFIYSRLHRISARIRYGD